MAAPFVATVMRAVENRVARYAASAIMDVVAASPIGAGFAAATQFAELLENPLAITLQKNLGTLGFTAQGQQLLRKLERSVSDPRTGGRKARWQRGGWAKSRQDWLQNAWRHDWRSQPRRPAGGPMRWSGTWMQGRLSSPVMNAPRIGKGVQVTSRKRRRIRRYRRFGRMAARSIKYGD